MDANLRLTEIGAGMVQPNIILPSQYVAPRKLTPEHELMIAVLRDAIDCVAKHRNAEDYRGRRLFDEATQWLLAEETDWPYSFENICAVLDLDKNAVRHALRLPERQSVLVCRARSTTPHTNMEPLKGREPRKAFRNHENLKGVNVAVKELSCAADRNRACGDAAPRAASLRHR